MRKRLFIFFSACFIAISAFSLSPKYEMRAVWLTTNWGLDWPSRPIRTADDVSLQKKELTDILDRLQAIGINMVFFQARIRGEVFYASQYEPWAMVLSRGQNPGYDPLAFVIDECHKRAMECHAWIVSYPVGTTRWVRRQGKASVVARHRSWCKQSSGEWFLDPGNPSVKAYLVDLVKEIVSGYDIDGIHLDYIRYPDRAEKFPDTDSFRKWSDGATDLSRWRENNITSTVFVIYDEVKRLKPWVKVSSSPLGRYASLPGFPAEWSCMEAVCQNPKLWLREGKHDFIVPMMYFSEENFYPFLRDWSALCPAGRVACGLGVYRLDKNNGGWPLREMQRQIEATRRQGVGQAYFRYENLYRHTGLAQWLSSWFYRSPALPPRCASSPVRHIDSPGNFCVETGTGVSELSWSPVYDAFCYVLYAADDTLDIASGEQIVAVLPQERLFCILPESYRYYAVTARDRYGNESSPAVWEERRIELDKYKIVLQSIKE